MTDGRSATRFAMSLPLVVTGIGQAGPVEATTRDVSSRGIFLYLPEEVVTGSKIEFTFAVPSKITHREGVRVHCKGTVVRVEHYPARVGVAAKITSYRFVGSATPES